MPGPCEWQGNPAVPYVLSTFNARIRREHGNAPSAESESAAVAGAGCGPRRRRGLRHGGRAGRPHRAAAVCGRGKVRRHGQYVRLRRHPGLGPQRLRLHLQHSGGQPALQPDCAVRHGGHRPDCLRPVRQLGSNQRRQDCSLPHSQRRAVAGRRAARRRRRPPLHAALRRPGLQDGPFRSLAPVHPRSQERRRQPGRRRHRRVQPEVPLRSLHEVPGGGLREGAAPAPAGRGH